MRTVVLSLAALTLSPSLAPAQTAALESQIEARLVVERAVKAHGGKAGLSRAQFCSRSETGTRVRPGKDVAFTMDVTRRLPDRLRLRTEIDKKIEMIAVLNGERGWMRNGGTVFDMPRPQVQEIRDDAYVAWLATLTPLLDGGFTLSLVPGVRIDGTETLGVKAESKRDGEARLYFTRATGLLARIDRKGLVEGTPGDKEYHYSAYRTVDGVQVPTRETHYFNGKKLAEVSVSGIKFLTRTEDGAFDRP